MTQICRELVPHASSGDRLLNESQKQRYKIEHESYLIFKSTILRGVTTQESVEGEYKKVLVRFDPKYYCQYARPSSELVTH